MAGVAWYHHERWGTVKPLRLRTFWITATAGWGSYRIPQNADRSPVADTCAGRSLFDENFSDYYYGISESESRRSVWQVIPRRMPGCPMSA